MLLLNKQVIVSLHTLYAYSIQISDPSHTLAMRPKANHVAHLAMNFSTEKQKLKSTYFVWLVRIK